jgi:hypothetical protein
VTALTLAQHKAAVAAATRSACDGEEGAAMTGAKPRRWTIKPPHEKVVKERKRDVSAEEYERSHRQSSLTAVAATADTSLNGHIIDISSEEGQQLLAD